VKALVLAISCTILLGANLYAESLKERLLDKMVDVYGGSEALSKAASYIQRWRVVRAADGVEGSDYRRVTLPNRLYIELSYPDRSETRILEGESGIKVFNGHDKREVNGPMLDAMKAQLMRLYTPLQLKEFSNYIKDRRQTQDGSSNHAVRDTLQRVFENRRGFDAAYRNKVCRQCKYCDEPSAQYEICKDQKGRHTSL